MEPADGRPGDGSLDASLLSSGYADVCELQWSRPVIGRVTAR